MAEMNRLRRRMVEDMKIRNLSPVTQRCYVHAVAKFARHFNRPPDQLGLAEVRAYQIHLNSTGASWAGFNVAVSALRFFYGVTLGRAEMVEREQSLALKKSPPFRWSSSVPQWIALCVSE
jgi:hypothetical protein